MNALKISLLILFSISLAGCNALFDPVAPQPAPIVDPAPAPSPVIVVPDGPKDPGLNVAVKKALKGHADVAKAYCAIYRAEAEITGMKDSPYKTPEDIAKNIERLLPVMEQVHGRFPEFQAIYSAHLRFLDPKDKDTGQNKALDKPLDKDNYRAWWVARLTELSVACGEAAK